MIKSQNNMFIWNKFLGSFATKVSLLYYCNFEIYEKFCMRLFVTSVDNTKACWCIAMLQYISVPSERYVARDFATWKKLGYTVIT
jgi:hypothetical protein